MQSSNHINVYDFDGTLYNGDSSIDFFLFALKSNKKNILLIPKVVLFYILYLIHFVKKEKFLSVFFSFLKNSDNNQKLLKEFWDKHEKKINNELGSIIKKDKLAVIVSASPEFLIYPMAKKLGVRKVIASKVDISNGNWLDSNCHGENKIKFLKKNNKSFKINNSYSDSYSDRFIANESIKPYMVINNKILNYDANKLLIKKINKNAIILSLAFFVIYFILGMLINYNYNLSNNLNLLFQSDTRRVYNDFVKIAFTHDRIGVHPLILFVQPFILLLKGLTQDDFIAIIIFEALIGSLSVKYIYKTIFITSKSKRISLLLSLIYGFSFSSIIFSTTFEIYSLSALSLIILWYYIIWDLKLNYKFNFYKYVIVGICTTGILLTNYSVFIVGILTLLVSKKINLKKFILLNIVTVIGIISLSFVQEYIWISAPNIFKTFTTSVENETGNYTSFDINAKKVRNIIDDVYMNGIVAKDVHVKQISGAKKYNHVHTVMTFNDTYNYKDILIIGFYIILIVIIICNFKYNKILNIGILLSLGGMSLLHLFYGNEDPFLYSQNFIYLIILLFGINYKKRKKIINLWLLILLLIEIITNAIIFRRVLRIISRYIPANPMLKRIGIYKEIIVFFAIILFVILIVLGLYILIKKYIVNYNKEPLIYIFCLLLVLPCIFIKLNTLVNCDAKLGTCNSNNKVKLNIDNYDNSLKLKYGIEIEMYEKYKNQYIDFKNSKNVNVLNNFNNMKFFFFGLGNRNKYVYKKGVLIDINTKKVYKRFDVEKELIIPNMYTVLIKTKQGQFYKIIEDIKSVRIEGEKEFITLPNTNRYIKIANLNNYKYSEILKVLYQEILFNIKDGIIYPNILVYDEVWYRDAAYGAMVLEKTGNIDLISNWILSINDYYDKANGEEENDNFGEVLYLLSLVSNKNNKMVNNILKKVDNIKIDDKKGIYISNKTDGSVKPSYQTEWLKFGLKKLDIKNNYNYNLTDYYSNLLWFNNYNKNILKPQNYNKYYPYLGYAQRHLIGDKANIYLSNQLYPLSWESNAKKADYSKMEILGDYFVNNKVSPTHVWAASELFLLLENKD